jgi:hypothetical protein
LGQHDRYELHLGWYEVEEYATWMADYLEEVEGLSEKMWKNWESSLQTLVVLE